MGDDEKETNAHENIGSVVSPQQEIKVSVSSVRVRANPDMTILYSFFSIEYFFLWISNLRCFALRSFSHSNKMRLLVDSSKRRKRKKSLLVAFFIPFVLLLVAWTAWIPFYSLVITTTTGIPNSNNNVELSQPQPQQQSSWYGRRQQFTTTPPSSAQAVVSPLSAITEAAAAVVEKPSSSIATRDSQEKVPSVNTLQGDPQQQEQQPAYHIVFSTSCDDQQNWESYLFFFHCRRVGQRGRVTRIASGCTDAQAADLTAFHRTVIAPLAATTSTTTGIPGAPTVVHQEFFLHLTPGYDRVRLAHDKYPYKYMNKPFGLQHWMEHALQLQWNETESSSKNGNSTTQSGPKKYKYSDRSHINILSPHSNQKDHNRLLDGIVILMDPDMVLLQPISHNFGNKTNPRSNGNNHAAQAGATRSRRRTQNTGTEWATPEPPTITKVSHGHPFAQQDGYLNNEWMSLNFTYITGDTNTKAPPEWTGPLQWNTGPPYMATVADMYRIVSVWTEKAPRVLDVYPELFAEMYGFIIATVMLQLPFTLVQSIVISNTDSSNREGWTFIDQLDNDQLCSVAVAATTTSLVHNTSTTTTMTNLLHVLPTALHYCGIYILGKVCDFAGVKSMRIRAGVV